MSYTLQILISTGTEAPEKAVLGLATALAAVHSGMPTCVVFAMRGAEWVADCKGNDFDVPGYPSVGEMIESVQEAGGKIEGCSSCVDQYCPAPVGADGFKVLRRDISRVGLPVVTIRMASVPTVTF